MNAVYATEFSSHYTTYIQKYEKTAHGSRRTTEKMATAAEATARRLLEKGNKSQVWKDFAYEADENGGIINTQKPICKRW